ncbi:MAG: DUF6850 family outer membrane beta-barrel protein [Gemmatimonadales bacterium]
MRTPVLIGVSVVVVGAAAGQALPEHRPFEGDWMLRTWSAFASIADLPRSGPTAPVPRGAIGHPAATEGLWWSSGNPGALPFALTNAITVFEAGRTAVNGPYRFAMEPDDMSQFGVRATSWQPLGRSGGAVGAIVMDRTAAGVRPYAATLVPASTDPFIVTDTTTPEAARLRVRLEGAMGWRLGPIGFGASIGLENDDHRSHNSGFQQVGRTAIPAGRVGVTYRAGRALHVGVHARWIREAQTLLMGPRPDEGMIFQLAGYAEPDTLVLAGGFGYFQRAERYARAHGVSATGTILGTTWTTLLERTRRNNRYFYQVIFDPPSDRWIADGWTMSGTVARPLGRRFSVSFEAWRATVRGDATVADLEGALFRANENALKLGATVRYAPAESRLSVEAGYSLWRTRRARYDFLSEVGMDLVTWAPGGWLAGGYRWGRSQVQASASMASYSSVGSIPDAAQMGPVYQRVLAPEMAVAASRSRPLHTMLSYGHTLSNGTLLSVEGTLRTVSAGTDGAGGFTPTGQRTAWSIATRVTVTR